MPVLQPSPTEQKLSSEQRAAILHELDAILRGPHFSGSKRCSEFLSFVVSQALDGNFEQLTERFLGAKLFNRPLDYETATDAVVRVKACEVRRRLTLHNTEFSTSNGVEIKLSAGSYIPEFVPIVPLPAGQPADEQPAGPPPTAELKFLAKPEKRIRSRKEKFVYCAAVLLLLSAAAGLLWRSAYQNRDSALNTFWHPVFAGTGTVNVRFGDGKGSSYWMTPALWRDLTTHGSLNIKPDQIVQYEGDQASSGNFLAALSVISLLERHGVPTQIQWPQDFQNTDAKPRGIVYIGAFSNPWTLELNRNLRFSFASIPLGTTGRNGIVDHSQPNRQWPSPGCGAMQTDDNAYCDYALITRIFDGDKHVVIAAGGLGQFSTRAAGQFLADPDAWSSFARSAPAGWEHKNLQIVLEMNISRGHIIYPRIVATNIW